uniref:DUF3603 family protein n=1 Tax=Clostridium sp. ZBS13 TaxID=2949971 RepID=UPI0020796AEF
MLYLHDVWVNWFEGEENGYNVCHFYEWRKDDTIELLDQVPLLKVDATLYHDIENELFELPQKMLDAVHHTVSILFFHDRSPPEFSFFPPAGPGPI